MTEQYLQRFRLKFKLSSLKSKGKTRFNLVAKGKDGLIGLFFNKTEIRPIRQYKGLIMDMKLRINKEQVMRLSRALTILASLIAMVFLSAVCTADETPSARSKGNDGIMWVQYDEGLKLAGKMDKVIFIDFYTNWCKFCHKMDNETFSNKDVVDYFNKNFVGVKVNAESRTKLKLPDGEFSGQELARMFGVRGYPTYWFLKSDGSRINFLSGYSPPQKFLPVLQYVGGKHYENMSFQEYVETISGRK